MDVEIESRSGALNEGDNPVSAPWPGRRPARRMTALDKARVTISRMRVSHSGRAANTRRSGQGNDTTHWRMATRGSTWSTRCAAVSTMRRAPHDGQNPRRLQLNATRCSWRQRLHLTLRNP